MFTSIFKKPEYYLQPLAVLGRYFRRKGKPVTDFSGIPLHGFGGDYMDRAMRRTGVYDLALTEVIWQLALAGGVHVDVGANIGYISRLIQRKAGNTGRTVSFEPNSEVLSLLQQNRLLTPMHHTWEIVPLALGEAEKAGSLVLPSGYGTNHGTARLAHGSETGGIPIALTTLDAWFAKEPAQIHLLKIDVEGFEWEVLLGAAQLLVSGRISHIVYEDFDPYPGKVSELLEGYGYSIYAIQSGWLGVQLLPPNAALPRPLWLEPNYLATKLTKKELDKKFRKGYTCLRNV